MKAHQPAERWNLLMLALRPSDREYLAHNDQGRAYCAEKAELCLEALLQAEEAVRRCESGEWTGRADLWQARADLWRERAIEWQRKAAEQYRCRMLFLGVYTLQGA